MLAPWRVSNYALIPKTMGKQPERQVTSNLYLLGIVLGPCSDIGVVLWAAHLRIHLQGYLVKG